MPIRRYGPGKFDTIVDSYVYGLALEGHGSESVGDAQDFGHYESVLLGPEGLEAIEEIIERDQSDPLNADEKSLIRSSYGAIVGEDSQGSVSVSYARTKKQLDAEWAKIEKAAEGFYERDAMDE